MYTLCILEDFLVAVSQICKCKVLKANLAASVQFADYIH